MLGSRDLARLDDGADRRHDRVSADPAGRRVDAIQLFDSWAGTCRWPTTASIAAPQQRCFLRLGAGADDAFRGWHRRAAWRDVTGRRNGGGGQVAISLTDAAARATRHRTAERLDPVVLLASFPWWSAPCAASSGRQACGRRGRGGARFSLGRRAARHRSVRDHRRSTLVHSMSAS